jgi:hypothetical protein
MDTRQFRTEVLKAHGAGDREVEELLLYNAPAFTYESTRLPLTSYLEVWRDYAQTAESIGAYAALKPRLVQLQFPIQLGISETERYRLATRQGVLLEQTETCPQQGLSGLILQAADRLALRIQPTLAGAIPVVIAGCREDFVALVQALTKRNEPVPIPDAMGACIVSGYNNWDRINQYRQQWAICNPTGWSEADWQLEFKRLIPQKDRYQDQFILLSPGGYSNVSASELGLIESEWLNLSLIIRLEHECTHHCTRQLFGSMQNNIIDELVADYFGIVAAIGYYCCSWFLRFLGLEAFPIYRQGGRLENYRGHPQLSQGAFQILQALVKNAAQNLEQFDRQCFDRQCLTGDRSDLTKKRILTVLTQLTLEELASELGGELIKARFDELH